MYLGYTHYAYTRSISSLNYYKVDTNYARCIPRLFLTSKVSKLHRLMITSILRLMDCFSSQFYSENTADKFG